MIQTMYIPLFEVDTTLLRLASGLVVPLELPYTADSLQVS